MNSHIESTTKAIIEITTTELFRNYMSELTNILLDTNITEIKHDVFTVTALAFLSEDPDIITKEFSNGVTTLAIPDFEDLIQGAEYVSIIVTTKSNLKFTIAHKDIRW